MIKKGKITLLYLKSAYSTPLEDVNLKAIRTMKVCFDINFGYADHRPRMRAWFVTIAIQVQIIEKYISLHKNIQDPHNKACIE